MAVEPPRIDQLPTWFRAARARDDLAVLEGFHAVKHALRFDARVRTVVAHDRHALKALAAELAPDIEARLFELALWVPREQLRELGGHEPHTGVLAVAEREPFDVDVVWGNPSPVVLLEEPRNLGNVGAVVRVAAAADAAGVVTTGTQDPWDPAALRGSAGLHYALPVGRVTRLEKRDRRLIAIDPQGECLEPASLPERAILAFGAERHGISRDLLRQADARLRIPMRRGVSSLNLATSAAAVLLSWRLATGKGSRPC